MIFFSSRLAFRICPGNQEITITFSHFEDVNMFLNLKIDEPSTPGGVY